MIDVWVGNTIVGQSVRQNIENNQFDFFNITSIFCKRNQSDFNPLESNIVFYYHIFTYLRICHKYL